MRSVFSKMILEAASRDPRILMLTGDHGYALFDEFRQHLPRQFVNAGVAEQNMVGVAAGLAKAGFRPIVYGLSAFVPVRVLEQIKLDVCYEQLGVTLIGDGAGLVYSSLGSSHQSTEDIAVLRAIPGMRILSPCDAMEMRYAMQHALEFSGPLYLRMGKADLGQVYDAPPEMPEGGLIQLRKGQDEQDGQSSQVTLLATGSMVKSALDLGQALGGCPVWSVPWLKPLDARQLVQIAARTQVIVTLEEHSTYGGLGGLVAEILSDSPWPKRVIRLGVQDRYSERCGSHAYLLKEHGIDTSALLEQLRMKLEG